MRYAATRRSEGERTLLGCGRQPKGSRFDSYLCSHLLDSIIYKTIAPPFVPILYRVLYAVRPNSFTLLRKRAEHGFEIWN